MKIEQLLPFQPKDKVVCTDEKYKEKYKLSGLIGTITKHGYPLGDTLVYKVYFKVLKKHVIIPAYHLQPYIPKVEVCHHCNTSTYSHKGYYSHLYKKKVHGYWDNKGYTCGYCAIIEGWHNISMKQYTLIHKYIKKLKHTIENKQPILIPLDLAYGSIAFNLAYSMQYQPSIWQWCKANGIDTANVNKILLSIDATCSDYYVKCKEFSLTQKDSVE